MRRRALPAFRCDPFGFEALETQLLQQLCLWQVEHRRQTLRRVLGIVDDPGVGPAECIVESDEGVVEHLIDDHLKQIEAVLSNTLNEVTQS